eukprot:3040043-Prymnesium_polylepis.1
MGHRPSCVPVTIRQTIYTPAALITPSTMNGSLECTKCNNGCSSSRASVPPTLPPSRWATSGTPACPSCSTSCSCPSTPAALPPAASARPEYRRRRPAPAPRP